ncbi:MAG: hypothetical protein QX189_14690 [Methylococcales bacterium]
MSFWFESEKRLKVAKKFQVLRLEYLQKVWGKDRDLQNEGFRVDDVDTRQALDRFTAKIETCGNVTDLLLVEHN